MESFKPITENTKEKKEMDLFQQTTVYINAGGRGTRLEPIFPKGKYGITKSLLDFGNEPLIQKHINLLSKLRFKNIIIGAGDHINIREYFKNVNTENLTISITKNQEDTGGDLIKSIREMENCGENILVENVDTILYIKNLSELLKQHYDTKAMATIVLTTRKGVPNENAFFVDNKGKVVFSKEASDYQNIREPNNWTGFRGSSAGTVVFKTDFLKTYPWKSGDSALSIYRDILPQLISNDKLYAYNNENNFFIDIGTPDSYKKVKRREGKLFNTIGKKYSEDN